jgi:hypothetical protein
MSMDTSITFSVLVLIIAVVLPAWVLINQAYRDKKDISTQWEEGNSMLIQWESTKRQSPRSEISSLKKAVRCDYCGSFLRAEMSGSCQHCGAPYFIDGNSK